MTQEIIISTALPDPPAILTLAKRVLDTTEALGLAVKHGRKREQRVALRQLVAAQPEYEQFAKNLRVTADALAEALGMPDLKSAA